MWLLLSCHAEAPLPAMESPSRADRILIIAPHIDDETLAAGGYAFDRAAAPERRGARAHEFPEPFFLSADANLDPPRRFAHLPWRSYGMSRATEQRKLAALRMYRTQRRDPHLYLLTEAFVRRNELFLPGH
jgi:hypothetical protein